MIDYLHSDMFDEKEDEKIFHLPIVLIFFTIWYFKQSHEFRHHLEHCELVKKWIKSLIDESKIKLDRNQIFQLWWGAYLHDLGQIVSNCPESFTYAASSERYNTRIEDLCKNIYIDNDFTYKDKNLRMILNDTIKNLCLAHTDYIEIEEKKFKNLIIENEIIYKEKNLYDLVCLLRFAELMALSDNKFRCSKTLCYKDFPSWALTILERCWPKDFRKIEFQCCNDFVKSETTKPEEESYIININTIDGMINNNKINRFLYASYIYQLDDETKRLERLFKDKKCKIKKIKITRRDPDPEFMELCKGFHEDLKLNIIYNYDNISLNYKNIKPEQEKDIQEIISEINGDYLIDRFPVLENYEYTGLKLVSFRSDTFAFEINISDEKFSLKYYLNDAVVGELSESKVDMDKLKTALYISLEFWCNYKSNIKINKESVAKKVEKFFNDERYKL